MNNKTLQKKYTTLTKSLSEKSGAVVAFSGGVDSLLLLKAAIDALNKNVIAVTAYSPFFTKKELIETKKLAEILGVEHRIINIDTLSNEEIANNDENRCYYCKRQIMSEIKKIADETGYIAIEGSNTDDQNQIRPGKKAISELNIKSPLLDADISKADVRELLKHFVLPYSKPSNACLATRIPTGTKITAEQLQTVEVAEKCLHNIGISDCRVRHHGEIARIEIKNNTDVLLNSDITTKLKEIGFKYITLDLGSL